MGRCGLLIIVAVFLAAATPADLSRIMTERYITIGYPEPKMPIAMMSLSAQTFMDRKGFTEFLQSLREGLLGSGPITLTPRLSHHFDVVWMAGGAFQVAVHQAHELPWFPHINRPDAVEEEYRYALGHVKRALNLTARDAVPGITYFISHANTQDLMSAFGAAPREQAETMLYLMARVNHRVSLVHGCEAGNRSFRIALGAAIRATEERFRLPRHTILVPDAEGKLVHHSVVRPTEDLATNIKALLATMSTAIRHYAVLRRDYGFEDINSPVRPDDAFEWRCEVSTTPPP